MTNFEWLAKSSNLIDFLYDLTEIKVDVIHNLIDTAIYGPTDIATNEKDLYQRPEDVFLVDVLKKWDIPRIPNHTGEWAIAKWLQLKHKEGEECLSPHEEKNIFDVEEIHKNCTVRILRNSATGEERIGWWKNE